MLAGSLSGSQGNTTASHNRYGAYLRNRTIPVAVHTPYAEAAKSKLSIASKIWGTLTAAQRQAWITWAQTNPITDRLGDKRILDGHAAVTRLNANLLQGGFATIDLPPAAAAPDFDLTITPTYDIGVGTFQIAYTATPLPASTAMQVWCAIVDSPGRSYVQNLYKLISTSAAAAASPIVLDVTVPARFGTLSAGQRAFFRVNLMGTTTGLLSASYPFNGTLVST